MSKIVTMYNFELSGGIRGVFGGYSGGIRRVFGKENNKYNQVGKVCPSAKIVLKSTRIQ